MDSGPERGRSKIHGHIATRWRSRLAAWPSADWLLWFDRRFGLYLVSIAAIYGLKWRNGYDLNAFMIAAGDVVRTGSAYATSLAAGVTGWGTEQVYVSPPFVAHLLAPFAAIPGEVVFVAWGLSGLAAVAAAISALPADTLARRAP